MSLHDPRARCQRGQASVEWLAVVVLVVTLLGLGAALAQAGYVGRRVTREVARAICLVGDGDCRRDQEPCVVGSQAAQQGMTMRLLFFGLGEDKLGLIEERSDGTFAVTLEDGVKGGLQAATGLKAGLQIGKVELSVGGEVTAALMARLGRGRTWIVGSRAEAERVLQREGEGRPPDATSGSGRWDSSADAKVGVDGLGSVGDLARAEIVFAREVGWRVDRRTGHRVAYVQASSAASATAGGGVLGLSGSEGGEGGERYAVEYDAAGRPVDLRVIAAGPFGGVRDLPDVIQPVAGLLAVGRGEGGQGGAGEDGGEGGQGGEGGGGAGQGGEERAYEVTAHLDLTDAESFAAARGLLNAIAARRATVAPERALRRRIEERGTVQARVLATQSEEMNASLDVTGGIGGFSADIQLRQSAQRLLAATSRGLDGQWITRTDCVG